MLSIKVTLLMLALGTLGAMLAVGFLLIIPTDAGSIEHSGLADEQLPVLVLVGAAGFVIGSVLAMAWAVLQQAFAPASPPA